MALEYVGNVQRMTVNLTSGYTAASGTMSLTAGHGARLPSSGDFWIITTSGTYRAFKVTARSTDTLTVTAAQDGTSDGNLDAGTELEWSMTASALDEYGLGMSLLDTYANLPSAGKEGRIQRQTDGPFEFRDTGAAWTPYIVLGNHYRVACTLPVIGDFSWVNQGSATGVGTRGYVEIVAPASTAHWRILAKSAPSPPYTIEFALGSHGPSDSGSTAVGWRDTSLGKLTVIIIHDGKLLIQAWTDETTGGSDYVAISSGSNLVGYGRIGDNNTNRYLEVYLNGAWTTIWSVGRTDHHTPDQVLMAQYNQNTTFKSAGAFYHWEEG